MITASRHRAHRLDSTAQKARQVSAEISGGRCKKNSPRRAQIDRIKRRLEAVRTAGAETRKIDGHRVLTAGAEIAYNQAIAAGLEPRLPNGAMVVSKEAQRLVQNSKEGKIGRGELNLGDKIDSGGLIFRLHSHLICQESLAAGNSSK